MAKVFGFTPIELRPGVDENDFFRFWNDLYAPLGAKLGWKGSVLKADRGERDGKVAVLWEIPDVEQRNRFVPEPTIITEEALKLLGPEFDGLNKKLDTYVMGFPFTDYILQE